MSDDEFGFSSGDEEELVAVANVTTDGKRRHEDSRDDKALTAKRSKSENSAVATPSPSTALANKILKDCFRLNGFRLEQEGAITRLLDSGSAVVVFPTGGGKSLCYQVGTLRIKNKIESNSFRYPL
jgi:hypothetical protein